MKRLDVGSIGGKNKGRRFSKVCDQKVSNTGTGRKVIP